MKKILTSYWFMMACFAMLNVVMYYSIKRFWIGGSSFLPMVGTFGKDNTFLYAFTINIGLIFGAFIGAYTSKEFILRIPKMKHLSKAVLGGFLIGVGITMCPGTCTTAFVTGIPMLSLSSFISASGIFIGCYIVYTQMFR
ncbi:MAG: hypothetical protein ACD_79C00937G0002 [uncultured bacterium]|nr:MAG: hypothetical protein ACD_79C00937G0002 [uncultured bacterium]